MRLLWILFCVVCLVLTSANNGREPKYSPRTLAIAALQAQGCTNLLVAHYIIDAAKSGLPTSTLIQRIAGTTAFSTVSISKWISTAQSYNSVLAVKIKTVYIMQSALREQRNVETVALCAQGAVMHFIKMNSTMAEALSPSFVEPVLNLPPSKRYLQMEAECYEKRIQKANHKDEKAKDDISLMWMEIVARKDQYRIGYGVGYESPVDIIPTLKLGLTRMFTNLRGHSWSRKFGWIGQNKTTTKPEVKVFESEVGIYDGISLSKLTMGKLTNGTVHSINLAGFGCDGTFPTEICDHDFCSELNFGFNILCGTLPNRIENLLKLDRLSLASNLLTGSLNPEVFSLFHSMMFLDLSFNKFSGIIPNIFDHMPVLTEINLSGNTFTGPLPATLGVCTALNSIKIFGNNLSGTIPLSYGNLVQLSHFNCCKNKLTGGVGPLLTCSLLLSVFLNDNELDESIPSELSNLSKLQILYLNKNKIPGKFLASWCGITTLTRLNLSDNCMRGRLPEDIGRLINLQVLILNGNAFIGPMPLSVGTLRLLKDCPHVFKRYPAEISMPPLGFVREKFERIHVIAPALGLDSMCWDPQVVHGDAGYDDEMPVTLFSGLGSA